MPLGIPTAGVNWVAEYSVSGIPWLTSSILGSPELRQISFYGVTREVVVKNLSGSNMQLGFTANGAMMSNNIVLGAGESFSAEVRCTNLWLYGSGTSFCVFASLTTIPSAMVAPLTGSNPNGSTLTGVG